MKTLNVSFIGLMMLSLSAFSQQMLPVVTSSSLSLKSSFFDDQGLLAAVFTCEGANSSPPLSWSNVPRNTQSFVLLLVDPDAQPAPFYHWVLYNIPPIATSLDQGAAQFPSGTLVGLNSWGKPGYTGACPPKGSLHHYTFSLYALDTTLTLPAGADAQTVLDAMATHVITSANLTGLFGR